MNFHNINIFLEERKLNNFFSISFRKKLEALGYIYDENGINLHPILYKNYVTYTINNLVDGIKDQDFHSLAYMFLGKDRKFINTLIYEIIKAKEGESFLLVLYEMLNVYNLLHDEKNVILKLLNSYPENICLTIEYILSKL